jgi:hypothetical protein
MAFGLTSTDRFPSTIMRSDQTGSAFDGESPGLVYICPTWHCGGNHPPTHKMRSNRQRSRCPFFGSLYGDFRRSLSMRLATRHFLAEMRSTDGKSTRSLTAGQGAKWASLEISVLGEWKNPLIRLPKAACAKRSTKPKRKRSENRGRSTAWIEKCQIGHSSQ